MVKCFGLMRRQQLCLELGKYGGHATQGGDWRVRTRGGTLPTELEGLLVVRVVSKAFLVAGFFSPCHLLDSIVGGMWFGCVSRGCFPGMEVGSSLRFIDEAATPAVGGSTARISSGRDYESST